MDIRRPRHITLPLLQQTAALDAPAALDYTGGRMPTGPITGSDISGSVRMYAGFGGGIYVSDDLGASWTKKADITNGKVISKILEFAEAPTGTRKLYAFVEGTAAEFYTSTDGDSWSASGADQAVVEDAIVWNQRLIGTMPIARIIYSKDGDAWSNKLTVSDIVWANNFGRVEFVGIYMAPWGEAAVHFVAHSDQGLRTLHVLDFDHRTAYPIPLGTGRHIGDVKVWQNFLAATDGYNVYLWDGQSVRNITWSRKGPMPDALQDGLIWQLIPTGDYLYATFIDESDNLQLLVYNGAGWTTLGPVVTDAFSMVAGVIHQFSNALMTNRRRIVAFDASAWDSASSPETIRWTLPQNSDVPQVGLDSFQDGPLSFITGWIDGGFSEISGALYSLMIDGYGITATETVKVEYQLDNNESGSWTTLGTWTSVGDTKFFSAPDGLEFRTVRFRISLDRGSTATKSPEVKALVLQYDKRPNLRQAWIFQIDVDRMVNEKVQVGGSDATFLNVWAALKTAWNTKTMIAFGVPNISGTLRVKITDMPLTVDDFRSAVDGRGVIDCTVIEPILTA